MSHKFFAKTLFLGKKVYSLPECHSTNVEAALLASEKAEMEGTIVVTDFQQSGKGQRGNSWESERGKNIILSIILRPHFVSPTAQFSLHMVCSLAIYDTLFPYLGSKTKIKWPNDIYYGDRKLCGILIENAIRGNKIDHAIVGVGLNVNQINFSNDYATSLKEITMKDIERGDLLEELLVYFEKRYLQLKNNQFSLLKKEYLKNLYRINEEHLFQAFDETFLGKITGVSENGRLTVQDFTGLKEYDFKEITFVRK